MNKLRLGFYRGADFSHSIGVSDWRIGLYMPEFGFETWIFGKGETNCLHKPGVHFIQHNQSCLPIPDTLTMSSQFIQQSTGLDFDAVICNRGLALAGAMMKKSNPRTKLILDIRSIPVETQGLIGFLDNLYFYFAIRSNYYDALSTISQGMLDDLEEKFHFKCHLPTAIWGSGFDPELFIPSIADSSIKENNGLTNQFIVMYHGSLSRTRGLTEVIHCMRLLLDRGIENVHLVFIGQGEAQASLIRLVQRLAVIDHVRFLPPIPHDKIPALIAACDLGIDPLPDHPWWQHQSALKVFEYLAMGKPVLATDIPCHRDISDAVLLVPNNSPHTVAQGIINCMNLSVRSKTQLREKALADSQKFTWKARAAILADFIHNQVL